MLHGLTEDCKFRCLPGQNSMQAGGEYCSTKSRRNSEQTDCTHAASVTTVVSTILSYSNGGETVFSKV